MNFAECIQNSHHQIILSKAFITEEAIPLPKVSYPSGVKCKPSPHHFLPPQLPLSNSDGKSTYDTLPDEHEPSLANSLKASFIPRHNTRAFSLLSCHALPGIPTANVRMKLSHSRHDLCKFNIGSTAFFTSTTPESADEVNIPISFVPARIITRDRDGLETSLTADLKPTLGSSMYSSMAEDVQPGRPRHRTTGGGDVDNNDENVMRFCISFSRWGP
mmetsp:Transcript_24624/g.49747  ORF Transcript_24624/g.49747 Transcript_24624/m.49747 type:complete len:217 (+) Transcript_24624:109-759(+)